MSVNRASTYRCLLDEQPGYLVPPRLLARDVANASFVNRRCWLSWKSARAKQLRPADPFLGASTSSEEIAWVGDPATGAVWPYWIGPECLPFIKRLVPGEPAPSDLPERLRWTLAMADILLPWDQGAARRREWLDVRTDRSIRFHRDFAVVPHLIPPFHLGAMRLHYRRQIRMGNFILGDEQVTRRFAAHDDPLSRFVQAQLTRAISEIIGRPIKPTYTYFIAYQGGALLASHRDRRSCEYSVTLLVDATPEPHEQSPWPFQIQTESGKSSVWQYIGEAVFYRGRSNSHWRDRLKEDHTSSSLLMHFVDSCFSTGPS